MPSLTGAVRQLGHLIFLGGNTGSLVSVHVRVPQSVWFILDTVTHNDEAKGQMCQCGSSCCLLPVAFPLVSTGQSLYSMQNRDGKSKIADEGVLVGLSSMKTLSCKWPLQP